MGDGIKKPFLPELETLSVARKSLVAAKNIKLGENLSQDKLSILRPGTGVSPMNYWSILNTKVSSDILEGELLGK